MATCPKRRQQTREARALLKLDKSHDYDPSALRKALKRCRKLPDAPAALRCIDKHPGKLSTPAESVIRVHELYEEMNNDGLCLYFANRGEHWKSAYAGLRTLAMQPQADLLKKAARLFAPKEVPDSSRQRLQLLNALPKPNEDGLAKLDQQLSRTHTTVFNRVDAYISKNAKLFTGVR